MDEKTIVLLGIVIVFIAVFYALITVVTKTQIDPKKESDKSNEERILNSLQKIEKHTFGIKIGIFIIIIYAFILRII